MKRFEILPHTADLRLKVRASSLEELFYAALEGMNEVIDNNFNCRDSNAETAETIEVSSIDESMLLIDFLSEILTLSHKSKCIFIINKIYEFSITQIKAELNGFKADGFDEDIKAVTYTEAKIVRNSEGILETIIVFDI